jgi:hypothetical protein
LLQSGALPLEYITVDTVGILNAGKTYSELSRLCNL